MSVLPTAAGRETPSRPPWGRLAAAAWALARPPVHDRRFWTIQALIVLIALADHAADIRLPQRPLLSFLLVTLFFVPATYAASTFGFRGSLATSLWCVTVDAPLIVVHHVGMERLAELLQLAAISGIAVFVGSRVDREATARRHAEAARAAVEVSEAKYRGLFEATPLPILVVEPEGRVRALNPAASAWWGWAGHTAVSLPDLVGHESAQTLLAMARAGQKARGPLEIPIRGGSSVWMEPSVVRIANDLDGPVYAILLRDVTDERRRQEDLKTFATEILRAHEEERRRLAQELHDETIQTLVLLCRQLDAVEQETAPLPSTAEAALRDARASAEGVLRSLREFAHTLRPSVLDDLGLVASLRQLTHHAARRSGIPGRFRVDGAVRRLPAAVELGVFRIAQEAVRNVERHAQASRFLVRLSFARDEVRLTVTDNGQGFAVPADGDLLAHRHLGLVGMRERAQLLGGSCEIRSAPTKGTVVHARIPVHDEELPRPAASGGRRA